MENTGTALPGYKEPKVELLLRNHQILLCSLLRVESSTPRLQLAAEPRCSWISDLHPWKVALPTEGINGSRSYSSVPQSDTTANRGLQ